MTATFGQFFLPGPTEVHPDVLAALTRPMIPHRGKAMTDLLAGMQVPPWAMGNRHFHHPLTGDLVRDTGCSLKVMSRAALGRIARFDGMHRFLPTLLRLAGERVVEMPVSHRPRRHGRSKYGMWGRVGIGLRDALGVRWFRRRQLDYRVREMGPPRTPGAG